VENIGVKPFVGEVDRNWVGIQETILMNLKLTSYWETAVLILSGMALMMYFTILLALNFALHIYFGQLESSKPNQDSYRVPL